MTTLTTNITVEVAYALPEKQYLQKVVLKRGETVESAILASGILKLRKDINLSINKVGIFNRQVNLTYIVHDGDRIEIYRPLIADPKKIRQKWLKK